MTTPPKPSTTHRRGSPDVRTLLTELARVLKGRAFYAPGNPELARMFEHALGAWQSDLRRHGEFALGAAPDRLEVPGIPGGFSGGFSGLLRAFNERDVGTLRVPAELDAEAFAALVELLCTDPDDLQREGGFATALAARAPVGFVVNEPLPEVEPKPTPRPRVSRLRLAPTPPPSREPLPPLPRLERTSASGSEHDALSSAAREMAEEVFAPEAELPAPPESPVAETTAESEAPETASPAPASAPPAATDDSDLGFDDDFELEASDLEIELDASAELELDDTDDGVTDTKPLLRQQLADESDGPTADRPAPQRDAALPTISDSGASELAMPEGPAEARDVEHEDESDGPAFTFAFADDDGPEPEAESEPRAARVAPAASAPVAESGERGLVQDLLRDLEDAEADVEYRELAGRACTVAEGLAEQGHSEEGIAILTSFARHADEKGKRSGEQCSEALEKLSRLAAGSYLDLLIARSGSEEEHSLPAAQILIRLGEDAATEVLGAACEERKAVVRKRLQGVLIAMGDGAVPALQRALASEDLGILRYAVRLAGELQNPALVPSLDELVERSEASLCQEVMKALGRIGDGRAIDALITALHSATDHVRRLACYALGSSAHPRAVNALVGAMGRAIEAADTDFAREAIRALGRLGLPQATPELAELLLQSGFFQRRKNRDLKLAAAAALGRLPGDEAVGALAQAAQSRDAHIRRAAQIALERRAQALSRE